MVSQTPLQQVIEFIAPVVIGFICGYCITGLVKKQIDKRHDHH
jgi:hypothetical protein